MRRIMWLLLSTVFAGNPARGADPAPPPCWPVADLDAMLRSPLTEAQRAETDRLVRDLMAADFAVRARASQELIKKGPGTFAGLREAVAKANDAELTARTAAYLGTQLFYYPSCTPTRVVGAIKGYESRRNQPGPLTAMSDVFESMVGHFERDSSSSALMLAIVNSQEVDAELRRGAEIAALTNMALTKARLAMISGDFANAQDILKRAIPLSFDAPPGYAALVAQRRIGVFDPEQELKEVKYDPAAHHTYFGTADQQRALMGYLLCRANGDTAGAATFSIGFDDGNLAPLRPGLIEARRWRDLGESIEARKSLGINFLYDGVAYQLAGEYVHADTLIAKEMISARFPELIFPDLLRNDRAEQAIAAAHQSAGDQCSAARLLWQNLRVGDARARVIEAVNIKPALIHQLIDLGFYRDAREKLNELQPAIANLGDQAAQTELECASALDRLGDLEDAKNWRARALARLEASEGPMLLIEREADRLNDQVNAVPPKISRAEYNHLGSMLSEQRNKLTGPQQRVSFLHVVGLKNADDLLDAYQWYRALCYDAGLNSAGRYEKTLQIMRGELSGEAVMETAAHFKFERFGTSLLDIALRRLHAMARDDLASELVFKWCAQENDPTCLQYLGDWALERGEPTVAVNWYQRAAVFNSTDASLMYRTGVALSRRPDSTEVGNQLKAFAPLLVLGDRSEAYLLVKAMRQFEGHKAGDQWYDAYVRRYGLYYSDKSETLTRDRDRAEARGNFHEALELQKELLFSPPQQPLSDYPYYLAIMANVASYHRLRVLDALSRGDFAAVGDGLWREMDNGPPDVELLKQAIPPLQKAAQGVDATGDAALRGMAEKVLLRAAERLREVVQAYPDLVKYREELTAVEALGR